MYNVVSMRYFVFRLVSYFTLATTHAITGWLYMVLLSVLERMLIPL